MFNLKQEEGFTLLELIVVVAIIAILAAVIVPQVSDVREDAKASQVQLDIKGINTALEKYRLQNEGVYPSDKSAIETETSVTLTNYSYATSPDNKNYVLAYDVAGDDSLAIDNTGSVTTQPSVTEEDKVKGNLYYTTSNTNQVLTTTN